MRVQNAFLTAALLTATQGLGLLLPAASAQPAKTLTVARAGGSFIGVGIQEIDAERAKTLKLREEAGVEITHVDDNSPAEKAGLKMGDVVLQYNGQKVEGLEQFSRMVRETPAGREVKLDISRNGAAQSVNVKVGSRPSASVFVGGNLVIPEVRIPEIRIPDIPRVSMSWRNSMLGVEAEPLDGQLAQYFGVKEGVLVRSVIKDSAAEKAGVKAGDVITKVDDKNVATPSDITSRLRPQRGKTVAVVVIRDHKEVTLSVALDADDRAAPARAVRVDGPDVL